MKKGVIGISFILILSVVFLGVFWVAKPGNPETPRHEKSPAAPVANVTIVLRTGIAEGRLVFIGEGGGIDGKVNPDLKVKLGDVVQVILINGEGCLGFLLA